MKKVLFVSTVDSHITHFHLPYLKLFKDNGYEVHVLTNTLNDIPFCDVKHKVTFDRNPYNISNIKAIKDVKKILLDNDFDIVHTHTPVSSTIVRLAYKRISKKINTRIIYTAHGFHFYKGAPLKNWIIFYSIEKYLSKYTDTLITINNEDYNIAKNKFRKCKDIRHIPGVGIDENKYNFNITLKDKIKLRKSLGLSKDDFVMISVGELNYNKNQIMQIEAFNKLKKYKNLKLIIAGDGNKKELEDKIHEYHLEDKIKLLGYRNDIKELLKISDLCISTSKREGLACNILEAKITKLPCIVTNVRGNRDLIVNGKNGYIVELNDVDDLKDKIELCIKNKLAIKDIDNKYLLSNVIELYKDVYNFNNKIPKIIHYVWLGDKKPKNIKRCINSWKKLKNYEFIEWNENNFDINKHPYCKKAYKMKKYAFVSDYIRAWAVYNYGGIYFDTDILLLDPKRLDSLLNNSAFIGYENDNMPFTSVFGAIKNHPFIKQILDYFDGDKVDFETPNTVWVTNILTEKYKCKLGNIEQNLNENIYVHKKETLCVPSDKSITVHAFTATWTKRNVFGKISTFLRLHSNNKILRIIYTNIVMPIKEKKSEKIYNNNNTNL